jgi:hypothetical protein
MKIKNKKKLRQKFTNGNILEKKMVKKTQTGHFCLNNKNSYENTSW